jgi:diaminohydroxyphosphoribosylaminopyrimidine deaminase/5-amino-6-(5-phosphoribosylamino)uracil reductase
MLRALTLALRGWGWTAPNPMVGAVVVQEGTVVGEGWHAEVGGPHAETQALAAAGARATGADVFVTLEPCNHQGRTPPCVDALIAAGVRRVIVAVEDPNPVAAGGIARLRAAGIEVVTGVEEAAARELNAPFLFAHREAGRPFVSLKLAVSLDGAIAAGGGPQWLTGDRARRYVHRLRANADAVAVGIGTALADDPKLTVRGGRRPRVAPVRVVFDQHARLPVGAYLARTARKVPTWVLAHHPSSEATAALTRLGVQVRTAADLAEHLGALRRDGIRHLFVEGGAGIAGTLLNAGLVDRLIIFTAPVLLGAGALPAFGAVRPAPPDVGRWTVLEHRAFGDDTMTVYAPPGATR